MTFLLTYHGTLLCRDGARLIHRSAENRTGLSTVRLDVPWDRMRSDFDRSLRTDAAEIRSDLEAGDLAGFTVHIEPDRRSVLLSRDGRYLSAQPGGATEADRERAAGWERFLPIELHELDRLLSLRTRDWVLSSERRVIPAKSVRLSEHHGLWFGKQRFDLRYQLPLLGEYEGRQLTLLRDGWRIVKASAFEPVVCYSAVGDQVVFDQLCLSVRSLLRWGRYKGVIHLLTDRNPADVLRRLPEADPQRISFKRISATDRVGAVAARYAITEWPELRSFQPILMVDTDIVFDADVEAMLAHIAVADRIVAPAEEFSPLRTADSVGAKLFAADQFDPGDGFGFNAGSMGIPNLHDHGQTLNLIRRIVGNKIDLLGRRHFSWVDQPIANYVAAVTGSVDMTEMNQYVRWGRPGLDVQGRRGFVHFWPHRGQAAKLRAMTDYAAALEKDEAESGSAPQS